jgi:hypothetical protein
MRGMSRGLRTIVDVLPLCFVFAMNVARAQGGPPMLTDDPGTPGPRAWEINIGMTRQQTAHGSSSELPVLDFNYGVGARIQLNYEIAWNWQDARARDSVSALGNSQVGVKWRFIDAGDGGWNISTYPRVELRNPGSRAARLGLVDDGTIVFLPFEFQRDLAGGSLDFELGHEFHSQGDDVWIAGGVFGHDLREGVEAMAELHGESSGGWRSSSLAVNFGTRVSFAPSGVLLLSVGRELHVPAGEAAAWLVYGGWQLTF